MSHLVLLSGWGIDARIWRNLDSHWPDDINVSTPDWPGYGKRAPLEAPTDLDVLAQAMARDLPVASVWVGWSLGGLLAATLLERLPAPRALVMLGIAPSFISDSTAEGVSHQEIAAFHQAFSRNPQRTWKHFLRWQASGEPSPRSALQQLSATLGDAMPADLHTLENGLTQLATLNVHEALQASACPIVYLYGEHDPMLPTMSRYSPALPLADSGHCPQVSVPGSLARVLTSLARMYTHSGRQPTETVDAR